MADGRPAFSRRKNTMHTYQYQPGDKPLEGYTIKSAAGHGGFGEVYYAVSDSGREVALKAVQGYEQIELRGISQCMNLKSPHLVTIFDVKHNDKNQPFVLMEYVAGPSLADLIDQSPQGLGPQKTAFFLREIAKGLSYLHDCGIVHRDLKPANIFYENGYVKIGDYGLSKAINADHHQSQTVTVGTVHYMAPEVGAGRYDRSIDIYAMGVVVYEMLTGRVPFRGDTPSEILMKHLSTQPDLNDIEEPFREAIKGAMAKDPTQRYQSVNEMVQAVFGEERIKQSMAGFSSADLSMVAQQVAKKVRVGGSGPAGSGAAVGGYRHGSGPVDDDPPADKSPRYQAGRSVGRVLYDRPGTRPQHADPLRDPLRPGQRRTLAAIALGAVTLGTGLLAGAGAQQEQMYMLFAFTAAAGAVLGLSIARKRLVPTLADEPVLVRRATVGGMTIFGSGLLALPVVSIFTGGWDAPQTMSILTLAGPLLLMDWVKAMSPGRAQRLSFGSAINAGLLGWVASWFLTDMSSLLAIGVPAAVMLTTQALSPFDPAVTEDGALDGDDKEPVRTPAAAMDAGRHREADHARTKHRQAHTTEQVNAYSAVVTANTSPKSRLITLLLALAPFAPFFGICGLHRFYVGKIWTGLLWFFTLGLLGVGQFIDVILILCGVFRDASGRPVTVWTYDSPQRYPGHPPAAYQLPAGVVQTAPPPPSLLGVVLSMVASLMMLMGMFFGTALAMHVPEAIVTDVMMLPGFDAQMVSVFGYEDWPSLMHRVGFPLSIGMLGVGGVLLAVARRGEGVMHMSRAFLGAGGLFIAAVMGNGVMDHNRHVWELVSPDIHGNRLGPAMELFLNNIDGTLGVFALVFLSASVLVLAWPPKHQVLAVAPPVAEGA
jgi:Protein kinase domain/TM2 domain